MTDRRARLDVALLFVVVCLVLAGMCIHTNRAFYDDDTYITLRYVSNWLAGDGITWNPGERVEGYSSFLHLVALATVVASGSETELSPRIVNFLSLFLLFGFSFWYFILRQRETPSSSQRLVAGMGFLLACGSFSLYVWALGGLEAPLYALLLSVSTAAFAEAFDIPDEPYRLAGASLLFGLAYLARPETTLFVGLSSCWLLAAKPTRRVRPLAAFLLPFAFVVLLHVLWRYSYYGDLLPNTFYAKAEGMHGVKLWSGLAYVGNFFIAPPFLMPLVLLAFGAAVWTRSLGPKGLYFFGCFTAFTAYVVWVGGDHMPAFRLFTPVAPLGALAFYWLLRPALAGRNSLVPTAALGAAVLVAFASQPLKKELNPRWVDPAAFFGRLVGEYIEVNWKPGALVALNTAGSTPFYSPEKTYIDMLGLNDRHIARRRVEEVQTYWQGQPGHAKGDGDYVLSREPEYIILGPAMGTPVDLPWFLSDLEMERNPEFFVHYRVHHHIFDLRAFPNVTVSYPWLKVPFERFTWYERVEE